MRVTVLFRAYADRPSIVIIREIRSGVPIICRPDLADDIEAGRLRVQAIGAHPEDLYELDEATQELVRQGAAIDWSRIPHADLSRGI